MRALLSFLVALGLSGSTVATESGSRLFCCNDERGKSVCGDILPQACQGRAYREIGPAGTTIRRVEAPLTPEQLVQRDAAEKRRKEEEERLGEQRRKDQALLNTYGSEKDIELMRERANADVRSTIAAAHEKIRVARQQRKKFEDEAEFYRKKTLPPEVAKGLRDGDLEIKAQESVIEAKNAELEAIRVRYDDDRRRYSDLARRNAAPR